MRSLCATVLVLDGKALFATYRNGQEEGQHEPDVGQDKGACPGDVRNAVNLQRTNGPNRVKTCARSTPVVRQWLALTESRACAKSTPAPASRICRASRVSMPTVPTKFHS